MKSSSWTEDDISLLWLAHSGDTPAPIDVLEANASAAGIGQIFFGPSLEAMFNAPRLPAGGGDPRTPDIVVQPNVGVVYTSLKKQAEHGGLLGCRSAGRHSRFARIGFRKLTVSWWAGTSWCPLTLETVAAWTSARRRSCINVRSASVHSAGRDGRPGVRHVDGHGRTR
jgi:hypothetical protein